MNPTQTKPANMEMTNNERGINYCKNAYRIYRIFCRVGGVVESVVYIRGNGSDCTEVYPHCNTLGEAMKDDSYVVIGFASFLITVFFTFVALEYKNGYVSIGCMVIIVIFVALFIASYGAEMHANAPALDDIPAHQRYTNLINGRHFLITKHTILFSFVRVYCEETNRYFYATPNDKQSITKWIMTQI